ncbi:MAG: molybdenum cofactor guanylyltransferase [Pyrinomonadaceae bacterium]
MMIAELQGFILIGGRSSRMGSDKSQLLIGQRSFVDRISEALYGITNGVSLVGENTFCDASPLPLIPDLRPHWSALGGIESALANCRQPWAVIVACDLPFVTSNFLRSLASHREGYDAVAPVQRCGRPQPLCAFYSRDTCLQTIDELITHGERRPLELLRKVKTNYVDEQSWERHRTS